MVTPYTPLRAASNNAAPTAATLDPPPPSVLTAANCDAPVNTRSDRAHALATERPLADASTPKETPNTPVATPSTTPAVTGERGRAASVTQAPPTPTTRRPSVAG
jgi:hypothetical protein